MKLLTTLVGILVTSNILCTSYQQFMYTDCALYLRNNINVVEKSINKDLEYIKEDLSIPQFVDGRDEVKVNKINEKIVGDIIPKLQEGESTAKEYYGYKGAESPTFPFEIYSRYTLALNNDEIISIYNDYYEFLGGAHGSTMRTSYTIDKNTEKLLTLNDLFNVNYDYKSIINNEIKKQIGKEPEKYFDSSDKFKGIDDNQNFYIEKDNLVIYYQQYEIAPYVSGIPEFRIPLNKFGDNYKYILINN